MQDFLNLPLHYRAIIVGLIPTFVSYLVALTFNWVSIDAINWIEILAVATSYACTYLCVCQSRWNYPLGVVTTLLSAYLFWQWGLYGSMLANIYLPIALIYGWFRWGDDRNTRPVTKTTLEQWVLYIAISAITYAIVFGVMLMFNATLPLADVGILVLTILAQWLLDNKKLENWYVWAVVNVLAIGVYFSAGLYLAGLQYIFFLLNTIYGWHMWNESRKPLTNYNEHV
jgi:nicotinamide mononucleotide transporter